MNRRELSQLLRTGRGKLLTAGTDVVTAPIQRAQPKRPAGVSARAWKKLRGKGRPKAEQL